MWEKYIGTVVNCFIDLRKLGQIFDDEGTGGAGGFVAGDEECDDPVGDVELAH